MCHLGDRSTRRLPPRLQRLLLRSGDLSDRRLGQPRSHRLDAGSSPGPTRRAPEGPAEGSPSSDTSAAVNSRVVFPSRSSKWRARRFRKRNLLRHMILPSATNLSVRSVARRLVGGRASSSDPGGRRPVHPPDDAVSHTRLLREGQTACVGRRCMPPTTAPFACPRAPRAAPRRRSRQREAMHSTA